jgi:VWFA-related protein
MYKTITFFLLMAAIASAQQVSPPATFHTGTRLVQVDVIAQDKEGKAVTDLRQEDFQVFDNGEPQEIRLFLAGNPSPAAKEAKTPGVFSNKLSPAVGSGYSVLLFDNLNMDGGGAVFGHTARARQKALAALERIPRGDNIAIYSLWCRFQVVREFTSDRDSLLRQLDAFAPSPGPCVDPSSGEGPRRMSMEQLTRSGPMRADGTPGVGTVTRPMPAAPAGHAAEGMADAAAAIAAAIEDQEMKQMAEHLAGIPGRKNLIWLTTTFRISPANLRRLIDASVAIYPVDTIGSTIALASEKQARSAPLRAIAAQTGGLAYSDRDDLDTAIAEALNDGRISYTLGYYQPDGENGAPVHRIGVRVNRAGVTLRYRTSYVIEPEPPPSSDPVHDLIQAMNRPVNATAIPVTASAARSEDQLDLSVSFDISGLDLQLIDELWKGKAEVLTRFMTAEGIQAGNTVADTMVFTLRPATYTSMLEKGAHYHKQIAIPAKAVELDVLVGSLATGKIGTLKIPLSEVSAAAPPAR